MWQKSKSNIWIRIKEFLKKMILGKETKKLEEKIEEDKKPNDFLNNIKVENSGENLVILKHQLSQGSVTVNELDNKTVRELIQMYKKSNAQIKAKINKI